MFWTVNPSALKIVVTSGADFQPYPTLLNWVGYLLFPFVQKRMRIRYGEYNWKHCDIVRSWTVGPEIYQTDSRKIPSMVR